MTFRSRPGITVAPQDPTPIVDRFREQYKNSSAPKLVQPASIVIAPLRVVATVDTIECFFRRPPKGLRTGIEHIMGRRIRIEDCLDKSGNWQGVRVCINQPTLAVLAHLKILLRPHNILVRQRNACISRVDVAIDFHMMNEADAGRFIPYLHQHVLLKWKLPGHRMDVGETTYWLPLKRPRTNRNIILYPKWGSAVRLELKLLRASAVKRAGLNQIENLIKLNPNKLFKHHIRLVQLTADYIRKRIRNIVQAERLQHLNSPCARNPRMDSYTDSFRSQIAKRAATSLAMAEMQEYVVGLAPSAIENIGLDQLQIPTTLHWVIR